MFENERAAMTTARGSKLIPLGPEFAEPLARYHERNREHFENAGPAVPTGAALGEWAQLVSDQAVTEWKQDRAARFVLVSGHGNPDGQLIGHIAFTQIVRGPFQACYLGFGLDREVVGRGLMKDALERAIAFAFDNVRLHRIMANHVPTNVRSARTLRSLGFVPEGYARDYLFIAGAWRDHVLLALTNPAPRGP